MSLPFPFTNGKSTVWIYRFIFYLWITIFTNITLCSNFPIFDSESSFKIDPMPFWCFSITLGALPYILELPYFQVHLIFFSFPKCINSHFSKKPRSLGWKGGINNYFQEAIPEQRNRKSTDTHIYPFLWVIWKSGVHTDNFILVQLQDSF